jgi:hypothetical protein
MDVKRLARFEQPGHWATDVKDHGNSPGVITRIFHL